MVKQELIYESNNYEVLNIVLTKEESKIYIDEFKEWFNKQELKLKQMMNEMLMVYDIEVCDNELFEEIKYYNILNKISKQNHIVSCLDLGSIISDINDNYINRALERFQ